MHLLSWFAAGHTYWALAIFVLCLWLLYVLASPGRPRTLGAWSDRPAFVALTVAVVFAFRWPMLFIPAAINPDEAQMGAQALTAMVDPLPWHGFDGATGGPVDSYVLMLPLMFGPLSFSSIHLVAILIGAAIVCVFAAGAEVTCGARIGRAATVIPLAFFASMTDADFWHYSSELVPVLLVTIALTVLAFVRAGRNRRTWLIVAGCCLALMPFAKLQATPIAAFTVAAFVVAVLRGKGERRKSLVAFIGAWLGTTALFVAAIAAGGSLYDAYISYIGSSLEYVHFGHGVDIHFFFAATPGYTPFGVGTFGLLLVAATAALVAKPDRFQVASIAGAAGLLFVSAYCINAPHHGFPHYLTFAVVPAAALVAVFLDAARSGTVRPWGAMLSKPYTPLALCASLVLLPTIAVDSWGGGGYLLRTVSLDSVPSDPVVTALRRAVSPGSAIAVWGWAPSYYVYTGTRMAIKDTVTYYDMKPGRYSGYYRARFMRSFLAHRPQLFVDAVAPGQFAFTDRAREGFEIFPALREEIAQHYVLAAEINGVRIYRRRS